MAETWTFVIINHSVDDGWSRADGPCSRRLGNPLMFLPACHI